MIDWHVLTGEYPPQFGGVGDYTRRVARGLAATGDVVHIWAPPCDEPDAIESGIVVHRLPDRFGSRSLRVLTRELDKHPDARLLLQYVPHAFGWRAANLPFCWWLRSRRRDSLWVMFHEVAFPFGRGETLSRNALAAVNGVMAAIAAKDKAQVDRIYKLAMDMGAKDEGAPGPRGDGGFYAAYFRDPDGNKLNAFVMG